MPRKTDSNRPADWLSFALEDLEAVRLLARHKTSYHLCRSKLAEALEKVLKADLISRGWFLERTHDLQRLADELSERDPGVAQAAQELAEGLAEAYFAERYPGFDLEDPDWAALDVLVEQVWSLLQKVRANLGRPAPQGPPP